MFAFNGLKRKLLISLFGGAALAACSSTDQNAVTGLKAPGGPRHAGVANGNIALCKTAGPAGTYTFHIDVSGGGDFTLGGGTDPTIVFDGTNASCIGTAYTVVNNATWTPGLKATLTISETNIPAGIQVDSIEVTDRFGVTTTTVLTNPLVVIVEGVLDIHTVKFFNAALPSVTCTALTGVINQPLPATQLTATGGSGGPYTFTATGLPANVSISSSGLITGTPAASGSFNYTVTVTDKNGHQATSSGCTLTVGDTPTANCVVINAVKNVAITAVALVGSGGTGGPYTFSATGLPTGITLSSAGTLSGTPTVDGTYNYTVTITDKDGHTGTLDCSVTVGQVPSTTCVTINAVQGVPVNSAALVGSGGTGGPYTFSATGLPAGLTMAANGSISGTPTASGVFSIVVTVTDKDGHTGTVNCSVTVNPPPTTTCVTITAVKGVPVSSPALVGTGGTGGPYTFSATGLPAGLTMAADGSISGTPSVSGSFPIVVTVTDKDGHTGTTNCSVTVNDVPSTTCFVINAVQGVAVSSPALVGAGGSGGPYTFTATGLPAGLTMAADGSISGTPAGGGTFPIVVTITDNAGHTGTLNCSVTVQPPPSANCVAIVAVQGVAITSVTMVGSGGSGGPYTFSATGLPAGLTMSSGGTISGTPTVNGAFNYTVTVTDKNGNTGTVNCSVTVQPPPYANCVAIVAVQGVAITSVTMVGAGGSGGPYTFSASGLPAGLTMSTGGTISGTPTVNGAFNYTVTVTDKNGNTGTVNCSVTVAPPPSATCVVIVAVQGTAIMPVTMVGSGGSGGPYTFSASGLPAGLTMSTGGTISGTPTANGTFNYTVTVTDKNGNTGTVNCSVTVAPPPSATCVAIVAIQGKAITPVTMVGSGGSGGPYTFSASGLPAGLTMSTSGTISGTPTVSGTFTYTVTVTDKYGHSGTVNCSVTVLPPPTATCVAIVGAVKGVAIAPVTLTGSGGAGGPYTFSATGLPAGLTISSSGTISGTPTVSGTFNYTVTITDKNGNTGTLNCSVTVSPPPAATCVSITAIKGVAITPVTMVGSGGTGGPYTFSATGLPAGLTMSTGGTISGTPTVSGTFSYTVTVTDKDGHSSTVNCSVTVTLKVGDYCSYTPGGWGAPPNGGNVASIMYANWGKVYSSSGVYVGYKYFGYFTNTLTKDTSITTYLPDGGTPYVFSKNYSNPVTTNAGEFGTQVLALQLNYDFSNKGIIKPGFSTQKVASGPLAGLTVTQVLALANQALGGKTSVLTPYGLTPATLTSILGSINGNYDNCTTNTGYLNP